jgi:hypothetical protein
MNIKTKTTSRLENELHQGQRVRLLRSAPDLLYQHITSERSVRLIPESFSHSSLQVLACLTHAVDAC